MKASGIRKISMSGLKNIQGRAKYQDSNHPHKVKYTSQNIQKKDRGGKKNLRDMKDSSKNV